MISKKERAEINKCELYDFCQNHKFNADFITAYQVRVNNRVDIYPKGQKYCIMHWASESGKPTWGKYDKIQDLLKYIKCQPLNQ